VATLRHDERHSPTASLGHSEAQIHGGRVPRPLALEAFGPAKCFQLPTVFSLAGEEF
jgi:hypothetical protein